MARSEIPGITNVDDWLFEALGMPTPLEYQVRFISPADIGCLVNLYHLARTALCILPMAEKTPYHRMVWASKSYALTHPDVSETGAYKDLCGLLGR